jgi:hypothetical protein
VIEASWLAPFDFTVVANTMKISTPYICDNIHKLAKTHHEEENKARILTMVKTRHMATTSLSSICLPIQPSSDARRPYWNKMAGKLTVFFFADDPT